LGAVYYMLVFGNNNYSISSYIRPSTSQRSSASLFALSLQRLNTDKGAGEVGVIDWTSEPLVVHPSVTHRLYVLSCLSPPSQPSCPSCPPTETLTAGGRADVTRRVDPFLLWTSERITENDAGTGRPRCVIISIWYLTVILKIVLIYIKINCLYIYI